MSPVSNAALYDARPIRELFAQNELSPFLIGGADASDSAAPDSLLDSAFYTDANFYWGPNTVGVLLDLILPHNFELRLFGLDYISFGLGQEGFIPFTVHAYVAENGFGITVEGLEL